MRNEGHCSSMPGERSHSPEKSVSLYRCPSHLQPCQGSPEKSSSLYRCPSRLQPCQGSPEKSSSLYRCPSRLQPCQGSPEKIASLYRCPSRLQPCQGSEGQWYAQKEMNSDEPQSTPESHHQQTCWIILTSAWNLTEIYA